MSDPKDTSEPMMTVMYGMPPVDDSGRYPWQVIPNPGIAPPNPIAVLTPCPACKRHIYGDVCPFCFAEKIAKAPSRVALEYVRNQLKDLLDFVDQELEKK